MDDIPTPSPSAGDSLLGRIRAREPRGGILGLGYVGLPLAGAFEQAGFQVIGFDVDAKKVQILGRGDSYLHHVLDVWSERKVKSPFRGEATLIRYCENFVIGFERRDDAERLLVVLSRQMKFYRLTLQMDKTGLIAFARPRASQRSGKGLSTLDVLAFTFYRRQTRPWSLVDVVQEPACAPRKGDAVPHRVVSSPSVPSSCSTACGAQETFGRTPQLFGVNGNHWSLARLELVAELVWFKWLRCRSQRTHFTWEWFQAILACFLLSRGREHGPQHPDMR